MTTAASQRKKNRKRQLDALKVKNNLRKMNKVDKIRKGKKLTTRKRVDGKLKTVSYYYGGNKISNIPKDGQRALVTKSGLEGTFPGGLPKDYKKTEKEQIKKVNKWRKSKEYKKIVEERKNKLKINKNKSSSNSSSNSSSSSSSGRGAQKFIKYKGKMYRRGTPMAKRAEEAERKRKALAAKGYARR